MCDSTLTDLPSSNGKPLPRGGYWNRWVLASMWRGKNTIIIWKHDISTHPLAASPVGGQLTLFYYNKTGGRPSMRGDSSCRSDPFVLKMVDTSPLIISRCHCYLSMVTATCDLGCQHWTTRWNYGNFLCTYICVIKPKTIYSHPIFFFVNMNLFPLLLSYSTLTHSFTPIFISMNNLIATNIAALKEKKIFSLTAGLLLCTSLLIPRTDYF